MFSKIILFWQYHTYRSENHVQYIESVGVRLRLAVKLHAQRDGVDENQREYDVLERLRRHQPPHLVLEPLLGYVAPKRLGFQGELDAVPLQLHIRNESIDETDPTNECARRINKSA